MSTQTSAENIEVNPDQLTKQNEVMLNALIWRSTKQLPNLYRPLILKEKDLGGYKTGFYTLNLGDDIGPTIKIFDGGNRYLSEFESWKYAEVEDELKDAGLSAHPDN